MARFWIKIDHGLRQKTEVLAIARMLNIPADTVVGKLVRFWEWVDLNTVDGVVDHITSTDVDAVVDLHEFGSSLLSVGWIKKSGETGLMIPKFDAHNGDTSKKRALKTEAQARWRKGLKPVDATQSTSASTTDLQQHLPDTDTDMFTTSNEVVVVSKLPTCPQQEILKLYEEILPELPQPRMWDGARATNLTARWKAVLKLLTKPDNPATQENALDYFRQLFLLVRKSDFLMGRKTEWTASLGWIVKAENFAKIIDGNYDQ